MGIIRGMARRNRLERPDVPLSSPEVSSLFDTGQSAAGVSVTHDKAMGLTAFWAGVRVISQTIAGLPCKTYMRVDGGRELAEDHHVYKVLQERPNPMMTPFVFREIRTAHCLTWGNSYAEIEYDKAGRVIALWPLLPDRTGVEIQGGEKVYYTQINNKKIYLPADRVLHVPGLGFDGLQGYNVIKMHRDSLGLSMAANEYGSTFFGNSGRPSGIITKQGSSSDKEREQLRAEWNQMHTGLTRAQRTAILWGGMEWKPVSLPPEEAQFLETRAIQIEEVARILNINPIFLQHFTKVTTWGSGVVQFLTAFAKFTILPWLEREEDVLNYDLFGEGERGKFYVKYSIEQLMRGDPKMQAEILEIERRNGILSADEWRKLNDENPLPDGLGEDYFMPLNMAPVDKIRDADDVSLSRRSVEKRTEKRSGIPYRVRLTRAHKAALEDAARRFVKRDTEALKKAAGKRELDDWIDEFYPGQQRYIEQTMLPVITALTTVIGEAAADEIEEDSVSMAKFAEEYTANLARREVGSSIGQIRKKQELVAEDDLEQELIDLADEWEERRPGKVAQNESVRASSGAARYMWGALGVSYLVWRANADACELCSALDGKRVGIDKYFVDEGTSVTAEGVAPLTASENIGGPPLHIGCQCGIEPE